MKRGLLLFVPTILLALGTAAQGAFELQLYMDRAPNKTLDPVRYNAWSDITKAAIVDGTFETMANGAYPGQLKCNPVAEWLHRSVAQKRPTA